MFEAAGGNAVRRASTFEEFIAETHLGRTTGRRLIREGRIPVIRAGRRVLVSRETTEAFLRGELNTGAGSIRPAENECA